MVANKIRVLVVDDQPYARRGVSLFLETHDDIQVVGEAENGQKAIALVEQLQPDVVLMDLIMHVMDGVTATRIIHENYPGIPVIVLTSLVDEIVLQNSLNAGAQQCISKDVTGEELAQIIRGLVAA